MVNDDKLPGPYHDSETGLHYNYFRDYDPTIGRYIQSDPIGLAGGLNTYVYASANPLKYIDPLGLNRFDICENFGDVGQPICEACVKTACQFAPVYCCEVDKKQCQGDSGGDQSNLVQCETGWIKCMAKAKPEKLPPSDKPKPPSDNI